jgi:hydrogenase nickel incorporation protein HypB
VSAPAPTPTKTTHLDLSKPLLDLNDRLAAENRALLDEHGVFVVDLLASPGAGKTSLILATIRQLRERFRIAVIEGDIASDVDSQRIKAQGIPAVQINTGGVCHLESRMIRKALDALDLSALDLIIIENVGNLVCPTDFYLGEDEKVMILSVPEGHDKPLKYPGIFQASSAVILNKIDTMPVFDFNERAFRQSVEQLNPRATVFPVSATTGQGIGLWAQWLANRVENAKTKKEKA